MNKNEDVTKRVSSLIGLAFRAGKIVSGDDSTMLDLKKGRVKLVLIAEDASNNTQKLFKDKSSFRSVPYIICLTKADFGMALGKSPRAVVGIKDEGFADSIKRLMEV